MDKTWFLTEKRIPSKNNPALESTYTLGNGYVGVRGFFEEGTDLPSETGTYMSGIFDNYDNQYVNLVNVPNFLFVRIKIAKERMMFSSHKILEYKRTLDMNTAILSRSYVFSDNEGRKTRLTFHRFLSMDDSHIAVQKITITPLNHASQVELTLGIDAAVMNIRQFDNPHIKDIIWDDHLVETKRGNFPDGGYISVKTKHTGFGISQAFSIETDFPVMSKHVSKTRFIAIKLKWNAKKGQNYSITKYVSIYTSRDRGVANAQKNAIKSVKSAKKNGMDSLLHRHRVVWGKIWTESDVVIEGNFRDQQAVRFNIFHLICGCPRNDGRASIGPRLLSHTRYKGNAFWDVEIFMLPFYIYTSPDAARDLLLYRYNLLNAARQRARAGFLEGAQFPWMSAHDGTEQCQSWDYGDCEIHITADIAYAVQHYYLATHDDDFLQKYGAEILIETARFWATRSHYAVHKKAYVIPVVKGPDEYCGIACNNAFTNIMAAYNLECATSAVQFLKRKYPHIYKSLVKRLLLKDDEVIKWNKIAKNMFVNYDRKHNLVIQDDSFLDTKPYDVQSLIADGKPAGEKIPYEMLHRIRMIKQADVILLMFLLNDRFSIKEKIAAWKFYLPITCHDSSLSYNTHSIMASELGLPKIAYEFFGKTARLDLDDLQGNTDKGLHAASLGGLWQTVVNGFAGMRIKDGSLHFHPRLPKKWKRLEFIVKFRARKIKVEMMRSKTNLMLVEGEKPITVYVEGKKTGLSSLKE